MRLVTAGIAIVVGVGGVVALFWLLDRLIERLPQRMRDRLRPYVFIGPAVAMVSLFLLYPALNTFVASFFDANTQHPVGLDNYQFLATDPGLRRTLVNNVLWVVFVPTVAVAVGLTAAVLADKLKPQWEKVAKSVIFLPMAISFVGASTIWLFIYAWRAPGQPQIGILNAAWTGLGGEPIPWVQQERFFLSTFTLIVIMIWLQAGFAMVLLSAAIKGVPDETLEAARIDGASELQVFWQVVVPQIRSTIVVVTTTILILVLKVFDIVYVMGRGRFGNDVIANRFITELLVNFQNGRAAVIVVFLIVVTIPFMIINIRRFREQEATR